MSLDLKRELLRHLLATIEFRCRVAVADAPEGFAGFRINDSTRSAAEIMAHIGDLVDGSLHLMKGNVVMMNSVPLEWEQEKARFLASVIRMDNFLASDTDLAYPIEKFVQGPFGDALSHIGQLVMMRRAFGAPVRPESYFAAEIAAGRS